MGVAVGAYLYRGLDGARIELLALGDKVGVAQDDIRAMQDVGAARSEEVGKRREELSLLEARQAEQEGRSGSGLPTRPEALGLSVQLTAYATEHSLLIGSFETTDGSVTVGGRRVPRRTLCACSARLGRLSRGAAESRGRGADGEGRPARAHEGDRRRRPVDDGPGACGRVWRRGLVPGALPSSAAWDSQPPVLGQVGLDCVILSGAKNLGRSWGPAPLRSEAPPAPGPWSSLLSTTVHPKLDGNGTRSFADSE